MVDTADDTEHAGRPERPGTTWGDRVRFVLRGIGQTLITLGVVVVLFVVYEVYVTNWFAEHQQSQVRSALTREWRDTTTDPLLPLPGQSGPTLPDGQGIAYLYIPRLGRDYGYAIVQGTSPADLEKGPGHYVGTALPGQPGNFAVAGHRVGKGEPFLNLDHLRAGDAVVVQTESTWFVYRIGARPATSPRAGPTAVPGREIVDPSDGEVLLPVPDHPGSRRPGAPG